jgi:hypothetical protein
MIHHASAILNCNGNRDGDIRRLANAASRAIYLASSIPNNKEYETTHNKIVLSLRDLIKQTGRNLLDEKVQLCIRVSCCVAYKVNVEIVPDNCKINLQEAE